MRSRMLLLTVVLLLGAACGTDDPDDEQTADTEQTTSTADGNSTTSEGDGPTTTDEDRATTESEDPIDPDADLSEALPDASDLPIGFSETEVDEDSDDDGTTYEASPECEALIERLEGTEITEGGEKKAFTNADSVEVTTTVKVATEQDRDAFEELVNFLGDCESFTANTEDGSTADATVTSDSIDLGDEGLVADLELALSGGGLDLEFGVTLVAAVRDDVLFSVEVTDGFSETFDVTRRDEQLGPDVAEIIDEKLSDLLSD